MREIKFKAKRKDNQEWVYGYCVEYTFEDTVYMNGTSPKTSYIFPMDERNQLKCLQNYIEVIPETICQYTGLKDKNGVEIYENDILQLFDTINEPREKVTIKWNNESACYEVLQLNGNHYSFDVRAAINPCEVLGNIFDNSELLEKSDKDE